MNRILVVEDDEHDMEFLLRVLKKWPTETVICTTAAHARHLFSNHPFHAVMVNLSLPMPEPDGVDLIQWMRSRSQEVTIFVVTGAEDPRRRAQALESGANAFFTKPYTSEDNMILLAQLEVVRTARKLAYAKGKRMQNWRTNLGGAFAALGTFLFGASATMKIADFDVPSTFVKLCLMAGFLMQGAGIFYMALHSADKNVVEKNLQEQRAINLVADLPTYSPNQTAKE